MPRANELCATRAPPRLAAATRGRGVALPSGRASLHAEQLVRVLRPLPHGDGDFAGALRARVRCVHSKGDGDGAFAVSETEFILRGRAADAAAGEVRALFSR